MRYATVTSCPPLSKSPFLISSTASQIPEKKGLSVLEAFQHAYEQDGSSLGAAAPHLLAEAQQVILSGGCPSQALEDLCNWSLNSCDWAEVTPSAARMEEAVNLLFQQLLPDDKLGASLLALGHSSPRHWREGQKDWRLSADHLLLAQPLSCERLQAAGSLAQAWISLENASADEWPGLLAAARWHMLVATLRPVRALESLPQKGAQLLRHWLQQRTVVWQQISTGLATLPQQEGPQGLQWGLIQFSERCGATICHLLGETVADQLQSIALSLQQGIFPEDGDWNAFAFELVRATTEPVSPTTPATPDCLEAALETWRRRQLRVGGSSSTERATPSEPASPTIARFLRFPTWTGLESGPGLSLKEARKRPLWHQVPLGPHRWALPLFRPAFHPQRDLGDLQMAIEWEARLFHSLEDAGSEELEQGRFSSDDQLTELVSLLSRTSSPVSLVHEYFMTGLYLQTAAQDPPVNSCALLHYLRKRPGGELEELHERLHTFFHRCPPPMEILFSAHQTLLQWLEVDRSQRQDPDCPFHNQRVWGAFVQQAQTFEEWTWPSVHLLKIGLSSLIACEEEFDSLYTALEALRSPADSDGFSSRLQHLWGQSLRQRALRDQEALDVKTALLFTLDSPEWQSGWESLRKALQPRIPPRK